MAPASCARPRRVQPTHRGPRAGSLTAGQSLHGRAPCSRNGEAPRAHLAARPRVPVDRVVRHAPGLTSSAPLPIVLDTLTS